MRRVILTGLLLGVPALLWAQRTLTFERLVIADSPVALAATTLEPANRPGITTCLARLEEGQARYRWDGGTVGATTGILLEVGDVLNVLTGQDAAALRFAKTGSTTGILMVTCWRP